MNVVYNEIDPVACAVLRHLSSQNIIAPGLVVERSIKDIHDLDLIGVTQFHGFAGAGLWSVAARLAGWSDNRSLWTASCPCQGESVAGKKLGKDDPRHLWPDFFRLVSACRPAVVVGEQVDRAVGTHWLDGVWSDMEDADYAFRAIDIPACSVNAPHRRNRIYWIAVDRMGDAYRARADFDTETSGPRPAACKSNGGTLAHANGSGHRGRPEDPQRSAQRRDAAERADGAMGDATSGSGASAGQREAYGRSPWFGEHRGPDADLGDAGGERLAQRSIADDERRALRDEGASTGAADSRSSGDVEHAARDGRIERRPEHEFQRGRHATADADGSFWSDAEWLACADGKARRSKPRVRLLVDGMAGRADLWRLAGNSIVPQLAAEVLKALKDELDSRI